MSKRKRPINVLYVNSQGEIGGVERFLDSVLLHHDANFVRPILLACKDGAWLDELSRRGVKVYCINGARLRQSGRCFREISRILQAEQIDLVHSSYAWCHALVATAAAWHGCKRVWFHHGPVWPKRWQGFTALFPADLLLTNSQFLSSELHQTLYWAKQTGVVHYGIDATEFAPNNDLRAAFRETWGVSEKTIAVGLIGYIDVWKGQDVFLEAALQLKQFNIPLRMFVIGGPRDSSANARCLNFQARLHEFVRNHQLGDIVSFTGHMNIKEGALDGLDVFVHASTEPEPFGMVILEAMAKAKPVIASAEGGPTEIITSGVNGFLVEPRCPEKLASVIQSLCTDVRERSRLGEMGHKTVLTRFHPSRAAKELESWYERVIEPEHYV